MLTPAALPGGVAGNAYSQAITASGGVGPYTFAVTVGSLPAGLNLASNGTLSGTPTASGTFNVTVTATDANSQTAEHAYTLTIAVATLSVTPAAVPAGRSAEHTSELQSLMRNSYAGFCLKKKKQKR